MSMYQAMILLNDMAKSNNSGIVFIDNMPILDNVAGDCLRLSKADGGYEAVMQKWRDWRGLTAIQIQLVWKMAAMLLSNCIVEMD